MSDLNPEISEWVQHYRREQKRRREQALHKFARELAPDLAAEGIRRIDIEYSGHGDSGAIDVVTAYGDSDEVQIGLREPARDSVCELAYELLPGGFENNEGGEGTLQLNLVDGTYHLNHGQHHRETTWSEEEGKF